MRCIHSISFVFFIAFHPILVLQLCICICIFFPLEHTIAYQISLPFQKINTFIENFINFFFSFQRNKDVFTKITTLENVLCGAVALLIDNPQMS